MQEQLTGLVTEKHRQIFLYRLYYRLERPVPNKRTNKVDRFALEFGFFALQEEVQENLDSDCCNRGDDPEYCEVIV